MRTNPFTRGAAFLGVWLAGISLLIQPSLSHAASGRIYMFTTTPGMETETNGFAGFLRNLGYTVTVEQDAGVDLYEMLDEIGVTNQALQAELISELTTNYDLIIVHRTYGSGSLSSSAAEVTIWNTLKVPILCCNAPYVRNNRWQWMDSPNSAALAAAKDLVMDDPNHPIVAGLGTDLFVTNGVMYGGIYGSTEGGTNMDLIAEANVGIANLPCLAVWPDNGGEVRAFYDAGGQTYTSRRVFFELPDWRSVPGSFQTQISWNGQRMVANAVAYAMTGQVPPAPPAIGNFYPYDGSQYNNTATTFSFSTTSPQAIPTSGIQVIVNGQDVSGSLQFSGTSTSRQVSYAGLVPNELYDISISVSNATGLSVASVQFDTFDAQGVQFLYPDYDNVFSGLVTSGAYRIFVHLQSLTPQVVSLTQSNASEVPAVARLKGVFYLPGSMTAPRLFALTDALRNQMIVRTPDDTVSFIPGQLSDVTLMGLYLVPVDNPPSTLMPALGQASPYPGQGGVSVLANLDLDLINGDDTVVPGSAQLFVDGADVTAAARTTISGTPSGAHIHYTPPNFLAPGQVHTVKVMYSDTAAHTVTNEYSFNTVQMPILPPSMALPVSAGISNGFNLLISMAPSNTDNIWINNSTRAELQLAGELAGPSGQVTNEISGTTEPSPYLEANVINYSYDGNPPVPSGAGQYPTLPGCVLYPFADEVLPGNLALSMTTWLELSPGVVTFGVASDSGFKLTGGYDTNLVLAVYEGPRGAQIPTESSALVYKHGLYPVRMVQYSTGAAAVEFYTVNNTNAASTSGRVLVNGADDSTTVVPVPAYSIIRPTLEIVQEDGQNVLSWYGAGNFRLQQTSQLSPASWTPVGQAPVIEGLLHTVSLAAPSSGNMFYRLELLP